tara:strand:- start:120 stop:338 length:219 start_codon:yes stop_codon:yes gene_type:complete
MTTPNPELEDVCTNVGYRIRTAYELVCNVTASGSLEGTYTTTHDLLCAVEDLLREACTAMAEADPNNRKQAA